MNVSASRDKAGDVHVSLCNIDPEASVELAAQLRGATPKRITGQVLTAATITAHNTFAHPGVVEPAPFQAVTVTPGGFTTALPPKSIVLLRIED